MTNRTRQANIALSPSRLLIMDHIPPLQASHPHSVARIVPNIARSLLGLVEERGHSPERLCRGLGFDYQDLLRSELLLSHQQVRQLILRAQHMLVEPGIGLAAGARQTPVSWGLPGLAMLTCETFGDAIEYGLAHQSAVGAMVDHVFELNGREFYLEVRPRIFDLQIESYLIEESFASELAVARCLVGSEFKPLRVDLAQPRPEHEELYRRFMRCPVRFDAGANRMTCESHWLNVRLPGYDRITCKLVQAQMNRLLTVPVGRSDIVETVSSRIRTSPDAGPRQKELAGSVNISERTLRRRLSAQETTYRELRDDARRDKARDLLLHTSLTISQVALEVGYSDARAFRRAFKRWTGVLPTELRGQGA